ncbi:hypothetical protein FOZ70_21295 [Burkholderia sp. COPS]|uniref:DUF6236 family protein n=1 Tax=Burkholderia sp. COPS TaxID=2597663 RepID=UPI001C718463|nr:DUF6236 family protein [Burkholderia sp. COPS]MBW5807275.1 hypothetical protein [Burkholderia sp. COPS]
MGLEIDERRDMDCKNHMRANALYFPYITLPDNAWTVKSLLYWDKLSSIVPTDHMSRPEQMNEFMRTLLVEGLVEPVIPAEYIHCLPRFDESFITLIEHRLRWLGVRRQERPAQHALTRIHAEKLGEIPRFLVKAGLAKQVDWAWYDVESTTATMFMSYLAACLGAIPEVNATPVTNKMIFAMGLRARSNTSARNLHSQKAREVVLRHLLPTPRGSVPLDKLLRFKRRYGHLLPPLRTRIEAHCAFVATLQDADDRVGANEAFLLSCKSDIAEIEEAMRPSFGSITLGTLAPLWGAGLTLHATDTGNVTAYAGAALSLAGATYQAINSIRGGRALVNRPLAYVAHAQRVLAKS